MWRAAGEEAHLDPGDEVRTEAGNEGEIGREGRERAREREAEWEEEEEEEEVGATLHIHVALHRVGL